MKYCILTIGFCISISLCAQTISSETTQKIAVIDIKKIIEQIPEFKNMEDELTSLSNEWNTQLDSMRVEIEIAKNNLNAERFLLTNDLVKKREQDLQAKEMQIANMQRSFFSNNGIFNTKRKNTMQQITSRIYEVIQEIAKTGKYTIVIDKMEGESVIYFDPAIDITQQVLDALRSH